MTLPVRLQLSRRRHFVLQLESLATNGLPAVSVVRPTRWGNPVTQADIEEMDRMLLSIGRQPPERAWQASAVRFYEAWLGGELPEYGVPPTVEEIRTELRGKNLACWCKPGAPCHADVLLELANRPVCEEVDLAEGRAADWPPGVVARPVRSAAATGGDSVRT